MEDIPNNHLGCIKLCKWCDIYRFAISVGAGFLLSTVVPIGTRWKLTSLFFLRIDFVGLCILIDWHFTKIYPRTYGILLFKGTLSPWHRKKKPPLFGTYIDGRREQPESQKHLNKTDIQNIHGYSMIFLVYQYGICYINRRIQGLRLRCRSRRWGANPWATNPLEESH